MPIPRNILTDILLETAALLSSQYEPTDPRAEKLREHIAAVQAALEPPPATDTPFRPTPDKPNPSPT